MDLTIKPRFPHEEPRRWPLGLSPKEIEETLQNLPVGRKHENRAELDAISQWEWTKAFLLQIVKERAEQG